MKALCAAVALFAIVPTTALAGDVGVFRLGTQSLSTQGVGTQYLDGQQVMPAKPRIVERVEKEVFGNKIDPSIDYSDGLSNPTVIHSPEEQIEWLIENVDRQHLEETFGINIPVFGCATVGDEVLMQTAYAIQAFSMAQVAQLTQEGRYEEADAAREQFEKDMKVFEGRNTDCYKGI